MNVSPQCSSMLRLGLTAVIATAAGFVLATVFELYRTPLMIYRLDVLPLC